MATGKCPNCGARLTVDDPKKRPVFRCPACQHVCRISAPAPAPKTEALPKKRLSFRAKIGVSVAGAALIAALVLLFIYGIPGAPSSGSQLSGPLAEAPSEAPAKARHRGKRPSTTPPSPAPPSPARHVPTQPTAPPSPPAKTPPTETPALSAEDLFAKASPAVVRVVVRDKSFKAIGQGPAFFVSPDGLLVTNNNVVKGAHFATALLGSWKALS